MSGRCCITCNFLVQVRVVRPPSYIVLLIACLLREASVIFCHLSLLNQGSWSCSGLYWSVVKRGVKGYNQITRILSNSGHVPVYLLPWHLGSWKMPYLCRSIFAAHRRKPKPLGWKSEDVLLEMRFC